MLNKFAQLLGEIPRLFGEGGVPREKTGTAQPSSTDRREFQRSTTDLQLEFVHQSDRYSAHLADASIGGALLQSDFVPPEGVIIEMHLPRITLPILAEVMHAGTGEFGVKYIDAGIGVLVTGWARGRSPSGKNNQNSNLNSQVVGS